MIAHLAEVQRERAHAADAVHATVEAIQRMGKKLEAQTNGRISIQMFPSMQLGGEKEMIEQAQVGALQIARISVGAMGPVVDELNEPTADSVIERVQRLFPAAGVDLSAPGRALFYTPLNTSLPLRPVPRSRPKNRV